MPRTAIVQALVGPLLRRVLGLLVIRRVPEEAEEDISLSNEQLIHNSLLFSALFFSTLGPGTVFTFKGT